VGITTARWIYHASWNDWINVMLMAFGIEGRTIRSTSHHNGLKPLGELLNDLDASLPAAEQERSQRLRALVAQIVAASAHDASLPYAVADDFLRALALVLMDWAWAQIVATPGSHSARWQAPALAFARHVRPEFNMRLEIIKDRCLEVQLSSQRPTATPA
jgi:hypothetical protein